MSDPARDTAGVVAPPPLIYAAALAVGLLLDAAYPIGFLPPAVAPILGWSLLGGGAILAASALLAMRRARTPVNPYKPATALVVGGPFRWTRNPLYLAMTLGYVGIAALTDAPGAILLLPAVLFVMGRWVIGREERHLERKFGEAYLRYKARVRRWI